MEVDTIGKECIKKGHGYLYKNILLIGFFGLVDDIIGVTAAGMKALKMNAFIKAKSADFVVVVIWAHKV